MAAVVFEAAFSWLSEAFDVSSGFFFFFFFQLSFKNLAELVKWVTRVRSLTGRVKNSRYERKLLKFL